MTNYIVTVNYNAGGLEYVYCDDFVAVDNVFLFKDNDKEFNHYLIPVVSIKSIKVEELENE